MSQMLHIMRKDVRRLRWLLALWLALLVARTLLVVTGAAAADSSVAGGLLLQQVWLSMAAVDLLLAALIAAQLVLDEPLVGFTPFWLTRPYDTGILLREKLLVAGVLLIVLAAAADLVMLSLFNASPQALVRAGAASLLGYASWALTLMAFAVLASSAGAFTVIALGVAAAGLVISATLLGFSGVWTADVPGYTRPEPPDATRSVVMTATYLIAAVSVVVYQYRHRRRHVAAWLAATGLVATVLLPRVWPIPFARGEEVQAGAWASDLSLAHDPSWGTRATVMTNVSRQMRDAWRRVSARITVSGAPSHITVRALGIRSRLQFADGSVLESDQMGYFADPFASSRAVQAALGARILTTYDLGEERETWTPMVTVTEQEFLRRRGSVGRLEADIDILTLQTRVVATLPLRVGESFENRGARVEIAALQRGTDSQSVVMRRVTTTSPLSVDVGRTLEQIFALRRGSSGEALMSGFENRWEVTGRPSADTMLLGRPSLLMSAPISLVMGSGGFSIESLSLRFPGRGYGKTPTLDPSWFDDAALVVLQTESAGVVPKRLVIENFAIPAN